MLNQEALQSAREHDSRRPGKFEGEQPETVYYYHLLMEGMADESGEDWDAFKIEDDERKEFDLGSYPWFLLESDSNGFVFGSPVSVLPE